jgi:nephrocystin-3
VEAYANPNVLAEIIREQFDELVDRLYPEDESPDPLEQERLAHEAHAQNMVFACIDRPAHLAVLNDFAARPEHGGKGFVVTGESGGGKTALLAAWARDWEAQNDADFLFQHYFGATPESASPEGFLRRLLGELKTRYELAEDIPADPEELREALPLWLAQTIGKGDASCSFSTG